jgi:hypothetical protein
MAGVTEKRQQQRESRQIAHVDLFNVMQVARLLAQAPDTGRAVRLVGAEAYQDPQLLLVLETGLVTTYARVFRSGEHYTPVPHDWVPAHLRDLHHSVLERRDSYDAHTDRAPANIHRRHVSEGKGSISVSYPEMLNKQELAGLAEIADALIGRDRRSTRGNMIGSCCPPCCPR